MRRCHLCKEPYSASKNDKQSQLILIFLTELMEFDTIESIIIFSNFVSFLQP